MSHILYSSIARAGGIDLFLGTEELSHPPEHPYRRRRRSGARLERLRGTAGRGLVRLGQAITRWGASLAPAAPPVTVLPR